VKAKQDFSIHSSGGHFVQPSGTCWQYAQIGMELNTHGNFHLIATSNFKKADL
jgi:hypothetical protein